jgi:hypothetical protein
VTTNEPNRDPQTGQFAPAEPEPQATSGWDRYEQAGLSPENLPPPVELERSLGFAQGWTDESSREYYAQQTLGHYWPEFQGLSLQELRQMAAERQAQMQDPFGQQQQMVAPAYGGAPYGADPAMSYGQQGQFDAYGNPLQAPAPQQPALDPREMWERMQDPIARLVDERLTQREQELRQDFERQQIHGSIQQQLSSLPESITPEQRNDLLKAAEFALWRADQTGQQLNIPTLIRDIMQERATQAQLWNAQAIAQHNASAPNTTVPGGVPAGSQSAGDLDSVIRAAPRPGYQPS